MQIQGKVAIVTGGASGYGKLLVDVLLSKGAFVVIGDVAEKQGQQQVDVINNKLSKKCAVFVRCDVTNSQDLRALFDSAKREFGHIDIVFNNAGVGDKYDFIADKKMAWKKVLEIDLTAVIEGTQLALWYMVDNADGGVIVNTASLGGYFPIPLAPVYSAVKHGVIGLTTSLGHLAKSSGIRVNAVAPSYSDTALVQNSKTHHPEFAQMLQVVKLVPVSTVVEAMIRCIEDDTLAGDVLRITPEHGIQLVRQKANIRAKI